VITSSSLYVAEFGLAGPVLHYKLINTLLASSGWGEQNLYQCRGRKGL